MSEIEKLHNAQNEADSERKAIEWLIANVACPSKEYAGGEIGVDHHVILPEIGELKAKENEDGMVKITLEKPDGSVVDMSEFLPSEWHFVSPSWCIKNEDFKLNPGWWTTSEKHKIISLGELKSKESMLALLHEMGHARRPEDAEKMKAIFDAEGTIDSEQFYKENSSLERNAWADAIRIMRELKEKGADFFKLFGAEQIRRAILVSLAYDRIRARLVELMLKERDMDAAHNRGEEELMFDEKDFAYLEELFDKMAFERLINEIREAEGGGLDA